MPSSTGKRRTGTDKSKSKKSRTTKHVQPSKEDDATIVIHRIDYSKAKASVPSIPLDPDLDILLFPLKRDDFLNNCLRKRAVHITCVDGQEDLHAKSRVAHIGHEMYELDAESILRETSSDNIFVWLRKKESGNSSTPSAGELIQSIEVSDVETAIALHKVGGHATYCRAPPKVEQNLVSSLLRSTGLGCGQYDPSGESVTSWGRGEVETFISTPQHITNWHFDFQENFTIQLSGIKRWTIQQGVILDPVRGCTPHYAAPEAVESQLKAAHLLDRKFRFGHPTTGVNAWGEVKSVDLRPGDTFYFPAGMWHKVETIEPGVSINVSLMATNYASVVSQAIQHILHQIPKWRQPVLNNGINDAMTDLACLLQSLPEELARTLNAQSIIPPVLRHAPNFQSYQSDTDDEEDSTDKMDKNNGDVESAGREDVHGSEEEDESQESTDGLSSSTVTDDDDVIDPREFNGYHDGWEPLLANGKKVTLRRNSFAVLHRMDEISGFYRSGKMMVANGDNRCNVFVLNVNYAGNEMHQSAVRTVFCDSEDGVIGGLYAALEWSSSNSVQSADVEVVPTQDTLPFLKFLLYHGYVILP